MRDNKQKSGALSKVQKLKKRLSQSFGKLGKPKRNEGKLSSSVCVGDRNVIPTFS